MDGINYQSDENGNNNNETKKRIKFNNNINLSENDEELEEEDLDLEDQDEVYEDEEDEFVEKMNKNSSLALKKEKMNKKITNIVKEFDLKSNPHLYKENITSDLYRLIYDNNNNENITSKKTINSKEKISNKFFDLEENKSNSEENYNSEEDPNFPLSNEEKILHGTSNGNDIPDCPKYNKPPEFDLDFLIKTVKKRFVTGGFSSNNDLENNNQEETDSDSENKSKKMKKFNSKKDEEIKKWTKGKDINNTNVDEENENEEQIKQVAKGESQPNLIKEFCSEEFGIFEKGLYIRIDIKKIKRKYANNFKPDFPVVLCTTNLQENSFGFLKIKFTKHLWYPKILKNNDPIILSIGWRKFQVTPIFCIEEKNQRLRMIKYTPKYTSCYAVCWGPLLPVNVACVALQKFEENVSHFRIAGTGDLIEINQNFEINKKLKLIGEPFEIYKKTAFVKGMFNSNVKNLLIIFCFYLFYFFVEKFYFPLDGSC